MVEALISHDFSSLQQDRDAAWQCLGGERGNQATRKQILAVLRAELALHQASPNDSSNAANRALLLTAIRLNGPEATLAAARFFDRVLTDKLESLREATTQGIIDYATLREAIACHSANGYLNRALSIRYLSP